MATQKVTPEDLKKLRKAMEDLTTAIKNNNGNGGGNGSNNNGGGQNNQPKSDNDRLNDKIKKLTEQNRLIEQKGGDTKEAKYLRDKNQKEIDRLKEIRDKGYDSKAISDAMRKESLAKVNKISGAILGLSQMATAVTDGIIAHRQSELKEQKNIFERTQKTFQANMEMSNVVAGNVVTAITSLTTSTATQAAQSLAKGAKEEANARIKLFTATEMARREFDVAETERKITEEKAIAAAAMAGAQGVASIANVFGPVGMIVGTVVSAIASVGNAVVQIDTKVKEFNLEKSKQENEIYQTIMGNVSQVADKMKNITDGIDDAANEINNYIKEADTVYKDAGLMFGWAGDKFSSSMRKTAIETAEIFNITAEEMKTMQENFIASSSRAVMLSGNEYNQMTAISKTFGVSQGEVASIMGTMNIFNVSVDQGYEKFDAMYHTVTKMGLSTTKFAKDLNNNLKLAQKYNFKGGVDNMMKLTKWAQQTRFNLNSAASFADSIMNDSLSGALEKSAKLQVLGGSAAIYSDPLGMLYDAGADVGNMAQRMAGMFNDVTGTFNKKTGETEFSWYENRMINERAKALGMDPGEVKDMIRQNQKQGVINKVLRGSGLDEEDRLAIGNRAQYVNGKWMVNTRNDEMSVQDLSKLTKEQREEILLPENQEKAILQIAEDTRSIAKREEANVGVNKARAGEELFSVAEESSNMNIETQNKLYHNPKYLNQLGNSIQNTAKAARAQAETTLKFIQEHEPEIEKYRTFVIDNLKQSVVLQESETRLLTVLAQQNGIQGVSDIAAAAAKIASEENEGERKKLIEGYKNKYGDKDHVEIARTLLGSDEWDSTKDGYGNTNGGMILGASNVKPIHDGAVNVKTSNRDQYLAAETGGPIDILLKQILPGLKMLVDNNSGSSSGTANINFGGKIELSQNGSTLNLVEMLKNDPAAATKFITLLIKMVETNSNGKPSYSYKMF